MCERQSLSAAPRFIKVLSHRLGSGKTCIVNSELQQKQRGLRRIKYGQFRRWMCGVVIH